jgi:RNA-binding protein PNO1
MPAPTAVKFADDTPLAEIQEASVDTGDGEFILEATSSLPADSEMIVSQQPEDEESMMIDEEGRPKFAPAKDIVWLYVFPRRVFYLIRNEIGSH